VGFQSGIERRQRTPTAAGVLLQFVQHGGARGDFKKDPISREMMIDAAHNLLRGNATDRETASQILSHRGTESFGPESGARASFSWSTVRCPT
jgi:hypothetical protein